MLPTGRAVKSVAVSSLLDSADDTNTFATSTAALMSKLNATKDNLAEKLKAAFRTPGAFKEGEIIPKLTEEKKAVTEKKKLKKVVVEKKKEVVEVEKRKVKKMTEVEKKAMEVFQRQKETKARMRAEAAETKKKLKALQEKKRLEETKKRELEEKNKREAEEKKKTKEEKERKARMEIAKIAEAKVKKASQIRLEKFTKEKKKFFANFLNLADKESRDIISSAFVGPVNKLHIGARAKGQIKALRNASKAVEHPQVTIFLNELDERIDVDSLPAATRRKLAPELWRFRHAFSLDHFHAQLRRAEKEFVSQAKRRGEIVTTGAYPVLTEFLEIEPTLRSLRYLSDVLKFQNILIPRLTRVVDLERARKMSVEEAINVYAKGAAEKRDCFEAFKGYCAAWNETWPSVPHFVPPPGEEKGEPIPAEFRINLSVDSKITVILSSDREEGRCAQALTDTLVKRHNNFIKNISLYLRANKQELLQGESAAAAIVSPRFFSRAMGISYDVENKLLPFVAKQCVDHTAEGTTVYNFANAQQYLMDSFFIGKPMVDASDVRTMIVQYADDDDAIDLTALGRRVAQEELTKDVRESILGDLGSGAMALGALQLLENVINFVSSMGASGGENVSEVSALGEVLLSSYMQDTLLMDKKISSKTIETTVRLKHIASLWNLLRSLLVKKEFHDVNMAYKQPLDNKTSIAVKSQAMKSFTIAEFDVLINAMRESIARGLVEGSMDASRPAKDFIGLGESEEGKFLRDVQWFQKFPADIPLSCIVDLFYLFQEAHKDLKASIAISAAVKPVNIEEKVVDSKVEETK
mmetsp:Transcript_22631/g.33743  ORF Transcript_22631/g.33743 Transcript_22631/m.33743 type:complete len:810 (-) Transcript_22631:163-2592(-)